MGMTWREAIDTPPVWLVAFIVLAWLQSQYFDLGLSLGFPIVLLVAGIMIGAGLVLFVLAVLEFRKHKTTIIPHQTPNKLIQTGVFARSRNPIYLGDALILGGLILRFDAVLSLVLLPVFVWLIERRFIISEENRMRRTFRAKFAQYEQKVRRWL